MSHLPRPLLPAVEKRDAGPPVGSVQKRRLRAQACASCRRFKTKCDGIRPSCGACQIRGTDCQYVATPARQAKRKYEDLRSSRSIHEELIGLIKTLPEHDAVEVFRRVRSGSDLAAILSRFKDGDLLLQMHLVPETRLRYDLPYSVDLPTRLLESRSPYLTALIYEPISKESGSKAAEFERALSAVEQSAHQIQYIKPYHAATLVEPRLDRATPSRWTTVCRDDALMRELIGAYFTHEYQLFPAFHKDYFLEDMESLQSDKRGAHFCSSLLVNAVLAYGCYCFRRMSNRFRYWDPDSLGYRFLAEAKRLWDVSLLKGKQTPLTTIQGVMIINVVVNLYGLDKVGDLYGMQGLAIAKELGLFEGNEHISCERERHGRNFTAWCLFSTDTHLNWHFFRPPFLEKPPKSALPDPSTNPSWYGELWHRYPSSPTLTQAHFAEYFKAKTEYIIILNEIGRKSFGDGKTPTTYESSMFVRQLLRWFQHLPANLTPKYIVRPGEFLLHLDYNIVLMSICQPLIHEPWVKGFNFQTIVDNCQRDINILLRLYYIRHSFSGADSWLSNPLAKLGFMSLQQLNNGPSPQDIHYVRSSMMLALQGLREQGRNYYITRTAYYIIRNQMRREDAELLQGTEDPVTAADDSPGLLNEVQSAWVPSVLDISEDLAAKQLSKLAKAFLTLELEETSDDA